MDASSALDESAVRPAQADQPQHGHPSVVDKPLREACSVNPREKPAGNLAEVCCGDDWCRCLEGAQKLPSAASLALGVYCKKDFADGIWQQRCFPGLRSCDSRALDCHWHLFAYHLVVTTDSSQSQFPAPRRRFALAAASSVCPASISSAKSLSRSCPLVPIGPQLRTKRTVPNRSRSITWL